MSNDSLQQIVSQAGRNCGFHLTGIAPVFDQSCAPHELDYFAQWVDEGRAGEMEYLKRRDAEGRFLRSSVRVPFPWVRSVVVCAVNYNSDQPYSIDSITETAADKPGWIARYAWSGRKQDLDPSGTHSATNS